MSILVNKKSKVLVQGFTGSEGTFHATQMIEYGTNVVGGVTPGKGGQKHLDKPVFNTVADCVKNTGADVSIIFVPPAFAADAIMESAEAGVRTCSVYYRRNSCAGYGESEKLFEVNKYKIGGAELSGCYHCG